MQSRRAYLDDRGDDDFDAPVAEDERRMHQGHDPNSSLSVVKGHTIVRAYVVTMLVEKMIINRRRVPSSALMPQISLRGAMISSKSARISAVRVSSFINMYRFCGGNRW